MGTELISNIRSGFARFLSNVGHEVRTEGQDVELWAKALAVRLADRAVEDVERLALHIANSGGTFSADAETAINGLHAAAARMQSVLKAELSPLPATEAPPSQDGTPAPQMAGTTAPDNVGNEDEEHPAGDN